MSRIIYFLIFILLGGMMLYWSNRNDKIVDAYWTAQMEECRARGANFDLVGGVCEQTEIY